MFESDITILYIPCRNKLYSESNIKSELISSLTKNNLVPISYGGFAGAAAFKLKYSFMTLTVISSVF